MPWRRSFAVLLCCAGLLTVLPVPADAVDAIEAKANKNPSAAYADIVPFVELDPLVLPMIQEGQVTHHVEVQIMLEVDPEKKDWVKAVMPKIVDRYIVELHGLLSLRIVREQPDLRPLLRERLIYRTNQLVGTDIVRDVLLSRVEKLKPISSGRTR